MKILNEAYKLLSIIIVCFLSSLGLLLASVIISSAVCAIWFAVQQIVTSGFPPFPLWKAIATFALPMYVGMELNVLSKTFKILKNKK